MRGGGHKVLAQRALLDRVTAAVANIACPVEGDSPRWPTVCAGWPDPAQDRAVPQMPFIAGRWGSGSQAREEGGQLLRRHTFELLIGVYCPTPADSQYAYALEERIEQDLISRPHVDGRYIVEPGFSEEEAHELMEIWPGYIRRLSVSVLLPAILQAEDEDGESINWEGRYDEPGEGSGVGAAE